MNETITRCHWCEEWVGTVLCRACTKYVCSECIFDHQCGYHRVHLSDELALLSAIYVEPEDDSPRLIYADYLEENELDDFRPEFIRSEVRGFANGKALNPSVVGEFITHTTHESPYWFTPFVGAVRGRRTSIPAAHPYIDWGYRRGCIEVLHCPWEVWKIRGPAIIRRHPIRELMITNFRPYGPTGGRYSWLNIGMRNPSTLPEELYNRLPPRNAHPTRHGGMYGVSYHTFNSAVCACREAALIYALETAKIPQDTQQKILVGVEEFNSTLIRVTHPTSGRS